MLLLGLLVGVVTSGARSSSEVWQDPASGLTWQVNPTGGKMGWSGAKEHCKSLSASGFHDWRLPTISELRTVIRGCAGAQTGGSCGVTDSCPRLSCVNDVCSGCPSKRGPGPEGRYWPAELAGEGGWYWSSSAVVDYGRTAWGVDFDYGSVHDLTDYPDAIYFPARCVR
jgi:hypothetical protein